MTAPDILFPFRSELFAYRPLSTAGRIHFQEEASLMRIEIEREKDGRWIAEVPDLPGVIVYGETRKQAVDKAEALALRVIADRLEHGETIPELRELFTVSA